jgi:acetoacetate decarboxylase
LDSNYVKNIWDNIEWDNRYIKLLDNKSVNIDLTEIWTITKSVQITTIDNHHVIYQYSELPVNNLSEKTIKLDITD